MADLVEVVLALRNVSKFVSDAKQATGAIRDVGETSEKAGKQSGRSWKGVAKWAGGAAALYGAQRFVKGAVSATEDLAKSTMSLQRATGMETQTASEWAALTKERGISSKQFNVGLTKLSKTMETARLGTAKEATTIRDLRREIDDVSAAGGKKAPAQLAKLASAIGRAEIAGEKSRKTLTALGVPLGALEKGDTAQVIGRAADAIASMERPSQRVALAQQLFGKSGQALLPILMKGRAGIKELLDQQHEYGNYLSGKSINDTKQIIQQQREMEAAYNGVRIQLGTALLPVIVSVGKLIVRLTQILQPLVRNATLLKVVLGVLTVVFVAWKIATLAQTVALTLFNVQLGISTGIIFGVVIALVALGVGFYLLYKRVGWFRRGVDAMVAGVKSGFRTLVETFKTVFAWVKSNWPLLLPILLGPFGLAAMLIIKHFGRIKRFALDVVAAIKDAFNGLVDYVKALPGKLGGIAKGIIDKVPGAGLVGKLAGKFATGGVAHQAGAYLVGERGPEVVTLPRGAAVTPTAAVASGDSGGGGFGTFEIVVPVIINERELGRAVARVTADKLARR